ncbi:MAG: carbon storage regulator CsrA [Planctomycetes bacterium]|nr:carbon storage regulator CsrA [Planctomycetota bacterium]
MLVLSRQRDESIMIGDDVEIIIVDVRGDKVRLGITAPKSIPVHRREIYDAIQREKKEKEKAQKEQQESQKEQQESQKEQQESQKEQQEKPQASQPTKES